VFVKVIENLHVFTAEQSPAAWLYKVATNLCLNRVRLGGRRRELLVERGDDLWHPLKEVAGQEAALLLRELWRELPDELLAIAVYYYVDGMAQAEIAELLGVSRRTVGNRIAELTLRAQKSGATRPGAELEV
jgi:RNA polymerase sigma-70 factor (ECF subfamily)